MLKVSAPSNLYNERKYIYSVIFDVFLGVGCSIEYIDNLENVHISGSNGEIEIVDVLFARDDNALFKYDVLPKLPLQYLKYNDILHDIDDNGLPIVYGKTNLGGNYIEEISGYSYIGIDIFGSAFFMLTRLEEYIIKDRDKHGRFPVESSIAYKAGFLERPIVNEYVELLWFFLKKIEPSLERKKHQYKVIPTHDIDQPFGMMFDSPLQLARHFAGDVILRKSPKAMLNRAKEILQICTSKERYIAHKSETFEFIDSESKKHNLKDMFFFMNSKKSWYDGNYTVDESHVLDIISKLVSKGHYVGLHPSFESYLDRDEIINEVDLMNDVFSKNQLPTLAGSRQHYLKWKNPETWQYYEDAGIPFDSSLTYAGHVGFRCGVCYPFPVFNLETRQQLKLIEHPLIIMDGTLYEYMGLSHKEALPVIKNLANECKKYNGEFVILWHNTVLDDMIEREFYSKMLDEVCCE